MESYIRRIINEGSLIRSHFHLTWIIGPIIYAIGLIISMVTGNLTRFIADYPWTCLITVITIATWATPRLAERHGKYARAWPMSPRGGEHLDPMCSLVKKVLKLLMTLGECST